MQSLEWVERLLPRTLRHWFDVVKYGFMWCHWLLSNRNYLLIRDCGHMLRTLRHWFDVGKHSTLWCHRLLSNRNHLLIRDCRDMLIYPKFSTNCNGKQQVWTG